MWKLNNEDYDEIQTPSEIFSIDLAYLKNPTFFEEQEVRIIRLLVKEGESFVDIGGNSEINDINPLPILNRKRSEKDIKYIKLPMKIRSEHIIKEVIIGPKNKKSIKEVEKLLSDSRLNDVSVRKSKSTYR